MHDLLDDYNECYGAFRINKPTTKYSKDAIALKRIIDLFEDSEIDEDRLNHLDNLIKKVTDLKSKIKGNIE